MITCYTVLEIWHVTDVIVVFHFGQFLALLPLKQQKKCLKKKTKKTPGEIIILHTYTKE